MEPQDVTIGQLKTEDVGRPFLRGAQAMPLEASPYHDEPMSTYENRNGVPLVAQKLGYGDKFTVDPQVEMKVRAVNEHIMQVMKDENMKDTPVSYLAVLARLSGNLAKSLEGEKNHGKMKSMLDNLFMQVSFSKGRSSQTYLQEYTKYHHENRISRQLASLGSSLQALQAIYK